MKKQLVKLFVAVAFVFALSTPSITGQIGHAISEGLELEDGSFWDKVVVNGTASTFASIGATGGLAGGGPIGAIAGGVAGGTIGAL